MISTSRDRGDAQGFTTAPPALEREEWKLSAETERGLLAGKAFSRVTLDIRGRRQEVEVSLDPTAILGSRLARSHPALPSRCDSW
jgi:hypothetical protein